MPSCTLKINPIGVIVRTLCQYLVKFSINKQGYGRANRSKMEESEKYKPAYEYLESYLERKHPDILAEYWGDMVLKLNEAKAELEIAQMNAELLESISSLLEKK